MGLLALLIAFTERSKQRVLQIENVALRDMAALLRPSRNEIEAQLRTILTDPLFFKMGTEDKFRYLQGLNIPSLMARSLVGVVRELDGFETGLMRRIGGVTQVDLSELGRIFWSRDNQIARLDPDVILSKIDWTRLLSSLIYIRTGTDKWWGNWASETPTQLLAGVLRGESPGDIVHRITGLSGQTAEHQEPLAVKMLNAVEVNVRYAIVKTASDARIETYDQMNKDYGLVLAKIWIAHVPTACSICLRLHGQVVDLHGQFPFASSDKVQPFGGILFGPPRHPNCRCAVAPWSRAWATSSDLQPENMRRMALVELKRRFPKAA